MTVPMTAMAADDLFAGGGELGARMLAIDWAATPLGPVERWPLSLKTCLRILLTSRQPMFVWWGPSLINLYNDAYISILGGKHPQALGQPAEQVWADIWQSIGRRAESVIRDNRGTYDEKLLLIMERNGYPEETYYTFSYSPVPDESGQVGGLICANSDQTAVVMGERHLATLGAVAEEMARARNYGEACTLAMQALGRNTSDFPFALLYSGNADAEEVGLMATSGIAPGHPAVPEHLRINDPAAIWPLLRSAGVHCVEELSAGLGTLPCGAWQRAPVQAAILRLTVGSCQLWLVAALNPHRLFDSRYREFVEMLGAQIASAINNAQAYEDERRRAEGLAEIDRAKTRFFANVSHELRTPLTLMLGPLDDLLNRSGSTLDPAARESIDVAVRNSGRLLKLVNTLLDFSRLEAGAAQINRVPVDLAAFTTDLASVFRSAIEKAGLVLDVDCPPLPEPVTIDRDHWEKIVLNLLSNAFKFTLEGRIGVTLVQSGGAVQLSVRDTGTGIPAADLKRVFERFHRVENARGRSHEGTGIGLALVHELVRLHGGSVAVTSEEGVGSCFTVSVPIDSVLAEPSADRLNEDPVSPMVSSSAVRFAKEALHWLPDAALTADFADDEVAAQAPAGAASGCIVVADDNADMRAYLRRLLGRSYRVIAVADGEAALEAVREHSPDLLISDVMMPRLDGFGLLQRLRSDPLTAALPLLMVSARAGEEARVEALEAGADDYLVKPFAARELLARVGAQMSMARLRIEAYARVRAESALAAAEDDLALQVKSLQALHELAMGLAHPQDLRAALQTLLNTLVDIHGADCGLLMLYNSARGRLETQASVAFDEAMVREIGDLEPMAGVGGCGHAFATAERTIVEDALIDPKFVSMEPAVRRSGVRALHSVPIIRKDGTKLGTIGVHFRQPRRPTAREQQLIDVCARHAADAIEAARAQTELRDSEQRFRQMADHAPMIVWVTEADGVFTYLNRSWFQFTGAPEDDLNRIFEYVHLEDRSRVVQCLAQAHRDQQPLRFDYRLNGVGDKHRSMLCIGNPRYADNGEFLGFIGSVVDVTQEREREQQARQSERLYRAIGESIDYGIWIANARGEDQYVSESMLQLTGMSMEQYCGDGWLSAIHPDDRERCRIEVQRGIESGTQTDIEYRMRGVDGQWHPILGRGVPVRDESGTVTGFAGINLDIGRLKQVEDELRAADARKNEFLAVLAHELRNPLAPIRSGLEVMRMAGDKPAVMIQMREMMDRQLSHMVRLIDDLLDLSRISRGKIELRHERVDLATAIHSALEASRPLIERSQHQLTVSGLSAPILIQADETRLAQVFANLLNNAAKYTRDKGRIWVTVSALGGRAFVSVKDDGIGIPSHMLPQVFEMFTQVDRSLERSMGGLGIGLSISKRLVEMHGGTLEARSEGYGKGCEFLVTLPMLSSDAVEAPGPAMAAPTASAAAVRRILVVDDNADAAASMMIICEVSGNQVRSANDGLQALEVADQFRPDVILMDIGMPRLNGYEACKRLRQTEWGRAMTIVALTGWGQDEDRQRTAEAGFDRHLVKPVSFDTINKLLAELALV